jgi:L-serine dehydratase
MKGISILNHVLGPVMRGPSSSHTAGPFYIGTLARALLGDEPASVEFAFDPNGSFCEVYRQQGSDLGFTAGMLGWSITDERFPQALEVAAFQGVEVTFSTEPLSGVDHPNTVEILMTSRGGRRFRGSAVSLGGGAVAFIRIDGWPVRLTGDAYEALVVVEREGDPLVLERFTGDGEVIGSPERQVRGEEILLHIRRRSPFHMNLDEVEALPGVRRFWAAPPVFFVRHGDPLFASAAEMVAMAEGRGCSLGKIGLAYESALLGLSECEVLSEIERRFEVMRDAVLRGLEETLPRMQLLKPSAGRIYREEAEGRVAIGGTHTRAAARAMAVMHVNSSMGVVCAAPTAGSAGVIPAVAVTLAEEIGLGVKETAVALLAASAVGLIVAERAAFAAEVAGCQVEIGASGAMAAAAVVDAAGGSPRQAVDAAAIAFQNTMGSVCDPVQGIVEVPCHTRNALAASGAFVCADLVLGGYVNPIPLDETIDAVLAVGEMLPRELKCTALGGLSAAPSARAMRRNRPPNKTSLPTPFSSRCQGSPGRRNRTDPL